MNHNYTLEAYGVRIRPVTVDDAEFIVELRGSPALSQFIGDINPDAEKQREWIQSYYNKKNDYYFVIESVRTNTPSGLVGLYAVDDSGSIAEWGRWVVKPGSLFAPGSAYLIYQFAFETLSIKKVFCRTLVENLKTLAFHGQSGAKDMGIQKGAISVKGEMRDAHIHQIESPDWPNSKTTLGNFARKAERFV